MIVTAQQIREILDSNYENLKVLNHWRGEKNLVIGLYIYSTHLCVIGRIKRDTVLNYFDFPHRLRLNLI